MNRRTFLAGMAAALAAEPGSTLVHEHVLVDFGGAANPGAYDPEEVFRLALPKLEEVRRLGCRRFLDCTPQGLGRDPRLLRRLSDASGIEIWTNTGVYGAAERKGVPAFVRQDTPERLARRFLSEIRDGIGGVKPRFIKTGVARALLDDLDRKLVRAAAIASRESGLTVASHTGSGAAALQQLEVFAAEKTPARRFVWVHAQSERDRAIHEQVARAGAWVEFDGLRPGKSEWQLQCVRHMAGRDLLSRTLIAGDSGWYHVGEPGGGAFEPYSYIYTGFLPQLEPAWREMLMVKNPELAFGI